MLPKYRVYGRQRGEAGAVVTTEDYYSILQVHYLAEPEVIESAYKRLAKKYHPDVCKSAEAETRMRKINEAYEVLRDAKKRAAYDAQRKASRPAPPPPPRRDAPGRQPEKPAPPQPAVDALARYFSCIRARDYDGAYSLLTDWDKARIARADFAKWQSYVARIYALEEFSLTAEKVLPYASLGGKIYRAAVHFSVRTFEKNFVMERLERDMFTKTVVLDGDDWHVFAGHENIRPLIARYESLSRLVEAKSALGFLLEHYSLRDLTSGLFTRKGFLAEAEREIERHKRYGNPFSLVMLALRGPALEDGARKDAAAAWCGKIFAKNLRSLDVAARWGDTTFLLLLPETKLYGACRTAKKLLHKMEKAPLIHGGRREDVELLFAADEYAPPLEKTLSGLTGLIASAPSSGGGLILTRRGRFE